MRLHSFRFLLYLWYLELNIILGNFVDQKPMGIYLLWILLGLAFLKHGCTRSSLVCVLDLLVLLLQPLQLMTTDLLPILFSLVSRVVFILLKLMATLFLSKCLRNSQESLINWIPILVKVPNWTFLKCVFQFQKEQHVLLNHQTLEKRI